MKKGRDALYFGVDVGGTFTKVALVGGRGQVSAKAKISSEGFSDKSVFIKNLTSCLEVVLADKGLCFSDVNGLGIGLPGPVDAHRGVILSLTNIRGWNHFSLAAFLKRHFPFPITVENDANCMALAESRIGAAKGVSCALCLTLGTGVGAGLIIDRRLYRGPFFLGGEVGHIPVEPLGPACACGGAGCLERYVGNRALMALAQKGFKRNISLEELSEFARAGEARAVKIWRDAGARIGFALAGVVNVLNPEMIVLGGGIAEAGDALFRSIRKTIERHAMKQLKGKIAVKKALLGNDAGVLGAALLSIEKDGE